MKHLFLLLLLIWGHLAMAQDFTMNKEIKKIDSLILYHKLEMAQKKTDSLYQLLNHSKERKKHKAQILEIKYRQALILDEQEISPTKTLQILLGMTDEAESERLHTLSCRIYLLIALTYEKVDNLELTNKYLNLAYKKIKNNKLEEVYSTYCIRKSSYHRFIKELDSVLYYAKRAKEYAGKYHNEQDLMDSYILLSVVANKTHNYDELLKNSFFLLNHRKKNNNTVDIPFSYADISYTYLKMQDFYKALAYSDSAYAFYKDAPLSNKYAFGEVKYEIYEALGNIDSAYYYFKQYHNDLQLAQKEEQNLNTKKLEEQYQNGKKEATIQSKNQQMILIGSLLGVIAITSILLFIQNRKINTRNKIINKQLAELSKTLEQKQVLLSELQHRVKNNLQHVISILEIQKESVDFNNMDELIRGNQNRIHSMALLHKKLSVSENVNEVDFKRYVTELAELVKESYDNYKKKINLNIKCEVESISIEKALPLGLIIVELVSNSMKHAFKKQNIGIINIEITKDQNIHELYYSDNGIGFDFNKVSEKGLGQEIIKGLIDQLDGNTNTKNNNGFELTICFK